MGNIFAEQAELERLARKPAAPSDTPVTDAAEEEARQNGAYGYVRASLCRWYERDRAVLVETIGQLAETLEEVRK